MSLQFQPCHQLEIDDEPSEQPLEETSDSVTLDELLRAIEGAASEGSAIKLLRRSYISITRSEGLNDWLIQGRTAVWTEHQPGALDPPAVLVYLDCQGERMGVIHTLINADRHSSR